MDRKVKKILKWLFDGIRWPFKGINWLFDGTRGLATTMVMAILAMLWLIWLFVSHVLI